MAKSPKTKPKSVHDSYRLRMVIGQWYILLYTDMGAKEIKRLGPFDWREANTKCEAYRKGGMTDLDRLNDTAIR